MLLILRLTALFSALIVAGCSNYQFSSNLDQKNFEEYFKPSQVKVYKKQDLAHLDYQLIGAVEGSSCQETKNQPAADIKHARTQARINAADMNANGIVFQSCLTFEEDKTCLTNIICYAQALDVDVNNNE